MILVGGENVYCTEVEAVLHGNPLVASAAVFGISSTVMGELVAAAVVLRSGASSERVKDANDAHLGSSVSGQTPSHQQVVSELTEWCRSRLAHYKVPHQVSLQPFGCYMYPT